ncbi:MAG: PHP domain-containing protein [Geobacteraceae bacterium]|nr:PHP domain-containing protein [Geobacteraceae bacterium]
MRQFMDLHIHTLHSDGVHTPSKIVAMAAEKGLKAVAITDHDSVSGVTEALEAGSGLGVEVVPAVELSIGYRNYQDVHLLGYFINHRDPSFSSKLREFRRAREVRAKAIVEKINAKLASERKGLITYDEVIDVSGEAMSRLHIARVLVDRGIARHVQDAFNRYLQPCDVPKQYFPLEEALGEIRRLGGVSVLAHPPSISEDRGVLASLIRDMAGMGLNGLEVFNNLCYKDDMIFFENLCLELGLAMTGGSDYHGYEDDVDIGIGRGGLAVAYRLLEPLRKIAANGSAPRIE